HGIGISCLSRRVVAEQLASGALVELPVPLPPNNELLEKLKSKH
ncbi:LysR family transcriptional regulator, partial [Serratia ureilytica]|nr:LysR family transcriptional regulator [Serratia ureilytica]